MFNVNDLIKQLFEITKISSFSRLSILDLRKSFLKARLYYTDDIFIQIYRNDNYNSTNFALILENQRIYARDQIRGNWHRHPIDNPAIHNFSDEGKQEITFLEFVNEVEEIITKLNLL